MTSIDTEASRYVSFLTEYRVLICRSCKHGISPNGDGIARHFMEKHITMPIQTRQSILIYCNSLKLIDPSNVRIPTMEIERITELESSLGWYCQEQLDGKECGHCCVTETSMKIHCRDTHGWIKSKGVTWKRQSIQTFFQGKLIKYFPVTCNDGDDESTQPLTSVDHLIKSLLEEADERDIEQRRTLNKVSDAQDLVTLTPIPYADTKQVVFYHPPISEGRRPWSHEKNATGFCIGTVGRT